MPPKLVNFSIFAIILAVAVLSGCKSKGTENQTMKKKNYISADAVQQISKALVDSLGEPARFRVERGVQQAADLWFKTDGTEKEFAQFCTENFIADPAKLDTLYHKLERNFEVK